MNIVRIEKPGRVEYRGAERTTLPGTPAPATPTPKPEKAPPRHLTLSEYFAVNKEGKKEHDRRIEAARREGYAKAAGDLVDSEDLKDIVSAHRQKLLSIIEEDQGRLPELARTAILEGWTPAQYEKAKAELPPAPPSNAAVIGTAAPAKEPRQSAKEGGYRAGRQDLSALWEKKKKEETDAGNSGGD